MEPCLTSWTGFRVVSIQCVRSYEETQHKPMRPSAPLLVIDSVPLDRRSAYTPRVAADPTSSIMLTHTPDVKFLCAIRALVSTARHPNRSDSAGGCLFAWTKNCVAELAATDASFAFATPTEWTVFPAGITPAQVVVRTPAAYLNVCEMRRYAESERYSVNS